MNEQIIFLGGSGFVGSYFVKHLIEKEYSVLVYDLKKPNFKHKKLKFIQGDIQNEKEISKIIKKGSIVFNFAGWADLETASKNEKLVIELNVHANNNLLKICKKKKVKRFIYASTLYVFSKYGGIYKDTKKIAEQNIENSKVPYTILRFGSLYGPGSSSGNAIFDILQMAIKEKKITYWGNGDEVRQYIHARDAAKICNLILAKKFENKSLLITGLEDIRMKDLLNIVKEMFDNKIVLSFDYDKRTEAHYKNTPFTINMDDNSSPSIGEKVIFDSYIDIGQGVYELANYIIKNRE